MRISIRKHKTVHSTTGETIIVTMDGTGQQFSTIQEAEQHLRSLVREMTSCIDSALDTYHDNQAHTSPEVRT
jgi:hypothetical protein